MIDSCRTSRVTVWLQRAVSDNDSDVAAPRDCNASSDGVTVSREVANESVKAFE